MPVEIESVWDTIKGFGPGAVRVCTGGRALQSPNTQEEIYTFSSAGPASLVVDHNPECNHDWKYSQMGRGGSTDYYKCSRCSDIREEY